MAADSVLNADCGTGAQYGDWDSTPITTASREIITIARK